MKNIKKTAGKLFAMILTVSVAVSCVVSTGIFTASAYTAPKKGKIVYENVEYNTIVVDIVRAEDLQIRHRLNE